MSNVVRYIRARETYDPKAVKEDFDLAQVLSAGKASQDLITLYTTGNPNNPVDVLGRLSNISVNIKAVSFPNKNTALVRFSTMMNKPTEIGQQNWQALIRFHHTSTPASNKYWFDNPLGFQVTKYRRDQETIAPVPVTPEAAKQEDSSNVVHTTDLVPVLQQQGAGVLLAPVAHPPVVPVPVPAPLEDTGVITKACAGSAQ